MIDWVHWDLRELNEAGTCLVAVGADHIKDITKGVDNSAGNYEAILYVQIALGWIEC